MPKFIDTLFWCYYIICNGISAYEIVHGDGFKDSLDDPIDVWYRPYDLEEGNEEAMQSYLSWEVDLTEQIERDGTTNFPEFSL